MAKLYKIAEKGASGPGPPSSPGVGVDVGPHKEWFWGRRWRGEGICRSVGPRGAQIFAHPSASRPALAVALNAACSSYIGFLVTHREPEAAAADLRAAILDAFRRTLDAQLRVLGRDHRETLTTRSYVATWLGESNHAEQAVVQFRHLLDDQIRVLGRDHQDTFPTRRNLARWLAELGRNDEAAVQFQHLPNSADAMYDVADILYDQGNPSEGEHWLRNAAAAGQVDAMYYVAAMLYDQGNPSEAVQWLRKAAAAGHVDAMNNLAGILYEQGNRSEAKQWRRNWKAARRK